MPRPRSSTTDLARLLHAVEQPLYVVDAQGQLVFCNQACLEWLGLSEEQIVGRRCAYHSSTDVSPGDAAAAGLCPPPGALAGHEQSGHVVAGSRTRNARFVPLAQDTAGGRAVLALVEPQDARDEIAVAPAADVTPDQLHELIRRFRRTWSAQYRADLLLGESPAAGRIRQQVAVAAASRASVWISGPTGSGRQHVAATIHYNSPGDAGPLVPLACSLLTADLLVSTLQSLCGKGPATKTTGTLVLGDVDQLGLDLQAALVPLLAARREGLRLIATARRTNPALVERGTLREDFAALVGTLAIEMPPLVRRRADIPLFAQFFLEEANARGGKQVAGFTPAALDRLHAYHWPGNSDELGHVVVEAHSRAQTPLVDVGDLPQRIHWATDDAGHPRRKEETIVLGEFLEKVERELIQRAMARAKGNKARAARLLGISRPRLYRRLVQLGLASDSQETPP